MDALYIAQSGLVAQQTRLDAISNNIANLNTSAYKKVTVDFAALMQTNASSADSALVENAKSNSPATRMSMNGVSAVNTRPEFLQGVLAISGHPLDIALSGDGFLEVESVQGERALTRGGRMMVDREGFLAVDDDWRLVNQINIPPGAGDMTISARGIVEVELDDGRFVEIGALEVVQVRDTGALRTMPNGLYEVSDQLELLRGEPGRADFAEIQQGFREQSNVSLTEEMVDLIVAQRGFQLNARVVQLADQLLETVNNLRR